MNYCGEGVRSTHQWIHEVVRYRIPVHAILSLACVAGVVGEGERGSREKMRGLPRSPSPITPATQAILSLFHIYFFQASPLSQLEGSSVEWCVVI